MKAWRATSLSLTPPSVQMADGDRDIIPIAAGEVVPLASAILRDLTTSTEVGPITSAQAATVSPLESVTINGETVNVTVSGLTRQTDYELSVTLTGADGIRWTKTLLIECVA